MKRTFILLIALGLLCNNIQAQNAEKKSIWADRHISASLHVGSTGVGIAAKMNVYKNIDIRLGYSYLPIGYSTLYDFGGLHASTDLKTSFSNLHLLAEWQPFKINWFRLVGGASYFMSGLASATLNPQDNFTTGNIIISPEKMGSLKIDIDWKGFSPYLGIGIGRNFAKNRFNINADLGTYYLSAPVCTVTGTGMLSDNQSIGDQLNQNLSDYRWFPLLQLNFNYKIR